MTLPWDEEKLAYKIAFWHGQKIVRNNMTIAACHGYGSWGDSPDRYAKAHWQEYTSAAKMILSDLGEASAKG